MTPSLPQALWIACAGLLWLSEAARALAQPVVVGSKDFPESRILGEVMAQLLEDRGFEVERKFGLGGTLIGFEALNSGSIDVYVEYTGTLERAILKLPSRVTEAELRDRLKRDYRMELLQHLGFNNTYALALRRDQADKLGLKQISDLPRHRDLRLGFSHDFLDRADCWPGLVKVYGLSARPEGIDHALAYLAVAEGKLDVTDVYATDGDIDKFDLVILEDDKSYFPKYLAAPLVRSSLPGRAKEVLNELAGRLDDTRMRALNAQVVVQQKSPTEAAHDFLRSAGLLHGAGDTAPGKWATLLTLTAQHLKLTLVSLILGTLVAIPLGVLVYRVRAVARPVVYVAGVLQTIPSLALLAIMIPLLGTGPKPAIVALFLYALLPILRNTALALDTVDPVLKKVSVGMGLTAWQRLWHVELPLAGPAILGGIKTAAVINIGTATLASYIGAGGLGYLIATGLQTRNPALIWEGAIAAALLAVLTELVFEGIEKLVVPRHLLQKVAS
jgi:osmoprotectant transport system permease protein